MGKVEVVVGLWTWGVDRECFVCAFCFRSLVGLGIDVDINGRWSKNRGVYLCSESRSPF